MSEADERLEEYRNKRDLASTPEPAGDNRDAGSRFVVQNTTPPASTAPSWAVPKGPSTDPSERRLALPTQIDDPWQRLADMDGISATEITERNE